MTRPHMMLPKKQIAQSASALLFLAFSFKLSGLPQIAAALQSTLLFGMLAGWELRFTSRAVLSIAVTTAVLLLRPQPFLQLYLFLVFQVLFIAFSSRNRHPGPALRTSSVMILSPFLLTSLPTTISSAVAVTVTMIGISYLTSHYSSMRPSRAIWWFVRRSLRKETVFALAMVSGLAALGLQRVRNAPSIGGISGLGDGISPGTVQKLALSKQVALKVIFQSPPSFDATQVYMRGLTLESPEDFAWRSGPSRVRDMVYELPVSSEQFSYKIMLSGRYKEFLPVVDYGLSVLEKGRKPQFGRTSGVFHPSKLTTIWSVYNATSTTNRQALGSLDASERDALVKSPNAASQKVIALANSFTTNKSAREFLGGLTAYLISQNFTYTLEPGNGSQTLEDFLFKTKAGYCEHYASATANLARVAGLPARVVSGFLGGEWSQSSLTLIVRDLDAHAWAEVWDDTAQAWIRFDPVAAIAPDRFRLGSSEWLELTGHGSSLTGQFEDSLLYAAIMLQVEEFAEWLRSDISDAVVTFLVQHSEEISLFGFVGILGSYLWVRRRKLRPERRSKESQLIRQLEKALARRNLPREKGETVNAWFSRVAGLKSEYEPDLSKILALYSRVVYEAQHTQDDLVNLRAAARRFLKQA